MKPIPQQKFREFVAGCRQIAEHNLVRCSAGNVSWRVDSTRMMIKPSRVWLSNITVADVAVCRIADGTALNGRTPSVEVGFHAGILRARPDVNVVLHFQTPCATTLACMTGRKVNYFIIPELPFYIGPVAEVPYLAPGSEALARAVTAAIRAHNMVQMRNHGQVTAAADFEHAIQNAVFFELAAEIILRAGPRLRPMAVADVRQLLPAHTKHSSRV